MKRHRHDDLLKDTFADGELDALRETSLEHGLAALRSKRRLRTLRHGALMVVPMLLLAVALFWHKSTPSAPSPVVPTQPIAVSIPSLTIYPAVTAADVAPVPTISDQELLAMFANRSVGLIGKPGQQKLVFFDQPDKSVN